MIPSDWSIVEADDICSQISVGIVVTPAAYYVDEDQGIRAFRSANVREDKIDDNNWVYISEEGHRKNKKSVLQTNDVLVVRSGYPGTACVVTERFSGSNCIDVIFARPDERRILSSYLCKFTNSDIAKRQILGQQGGLAQKHFNVGAYKKLKVLLPPLPEQKKIADILSTWDNALETTRKLLANAEAQKRALMQQLLTGKRRLPGFEGREWEHVKLGELADDKIINSFIDGDWIERPHLTSSGIRLIQTGNIGVGSFKNRSKKYISERSFKELRCKEVRVGDVLICRLADPAGRACIVPELDEKKMITSVDVTIFRPDPNRSDTTFVIELINSPATLYRIAERCGGSTRTRVARSQLYDLPLCIPSADEQERIAEVARMCQRQIENIRCDLDRLRTEKRALMQQLLTGKRRVKL